MKRRDLIRHLENHGCEFLREGANHTIYVNRCGQRSSSLAFHGSPDIAYVDEDVHLMADE